MLYFTYINVEMRPLRTYEEKYVCRSKCMAVCGSGLCFLSLRCVSNIVSKNFIFWPVFTFRAAVVKLLLWVRVSVRVMVKLRVRIRVRIGLGLVLQ